MEIVIHYKGCRKLVIICITKLLLQRSHYYAALHLFHKLITRSISIGELVDQFYTKLFYCFNSVRVFTFTFRTFFKL